MISSRVNCDILLKERHLISTPPVLTFFFFFFVFFPLVCLPPPFSSSSCLLRLLLLLWQVFFFFFLVDLSTESFYSWCATTQGARNIVVENDLFIQQWVYMSLGIHKGCWSVVRIKLCHSPPPHTHTPPNLPPVKCRTSPPTWLILGDRFLPCGRRISRKQLCSSRRLWERR